ncbi:MAG: D-alanine--D-alanine ligase A [Sodalis sp. Psp]|nr:D-alanine--D-alanine ligase A [Sodalis sp. Psp]MCR3756659.1 D-alanine--D-alanine ligase A [Sodalis sp. Ppy]
MEKTCVGVIFGGRSAEHEVSLQSAQNIVNAIDKEKFDVMLLGIDKQGLWNIFDYSDYLLHGNNLAFVTLNNSTSGVAPLPGRQQCQLMQPNFSDVLLRVDVIFPIVHGTLGEDGSLQGLLRMANMPYVGSSVLGSAISMDKDIAKRLLRDAGLTVAPSLTLTRSQRSCIHFDQVTAILGLPLFVKPANQGSSVGISKVINRESFKKALTLAFSFDHKVLVETAITGRELECAVLGNDEPEASLCGEIVLRDNFYSYQTKYINEIGAQVVVPADISEAVSDNIRDTALRAFQALNCSGMARVDVFLTPYGKVVVNEVNTFPGFTNISMYPKLWQASGLNYSDLITRLIELALTRYRQDQILISSLTLSTPDWD